MGGWEYYKTNEELGPWGEKISNLLVWKLWMPIFAASLAIVALLYVLTYATVGIGAIITGLVTTIIMEVIFTAILGSLEIEKRPIPTAIPETITIPALIYFLKSIYNSVGHSSKSNKDNSNDWLKFVGSILGLISAILTVVLLAKYDPTGTIGIGVTFTAALFGVIFSVVALALTPVDLDLIPASLAAVFGAIGLGAEYSWRGKVNLSPSTRGLLYLADGFCAASIGIYIMTIIT